MMGNVMVINEVMLVNELFSFRFVFWNLFVSIRCRLEICP